jgi:hypothetical protein
MSPTSPRTATHRVDLLGPGGLTAHRASFDRRDALRAWCQAIEPGADIDLDWLERATEELLADAGAVHLGGRGDSADVVRRADGRAVPATIDRRRYTTTELLATERHLLDTVARARGTGLARVEPDAVATMVARFPGLTPGQDAMVRQLTTSGFGVEVVVGKAGSGKTHALAVARATWAAAGVEVRGVGLAARAAAELEAAAGIPSTTVAKLLHDLEIPGERLVPGSVLVVDEAGMVDTRRLAALLRHARAADVKVVLVGDHRQLPEIEAGGAFAALVTTGPAIELTENRRQHESWERAALEELRNGDVTLALTRYRSEDRVEVAEESAMVRDRMIAHWLAVRDEGATAVMVAVANRDVEDLNRRARCARVLRGEVAAEGPAVDDVVLGVGDEILFLRNDRRLGVINSMSGVIRCADPVTARLSVEVPGGRTIQVPPEYVSAGHVTHAYATTVHKAQGLTVDHTLVLGDDRLYREAGYVSMSRGRRSNRLYVVRRDRDEALELHAVDRDPRDPLDSLTRALHRSGAHELATRERQRLALPATEDLASLWRRQDDPERARRGWVGIEITRAAAAAGRSAEVGLHPEVLDVLGAPPDSPAGRAGWRSAAGAIVSYRARWHMGDDEAGLGSTDVIGERAAHRAEVMEAVDAVYASEVDLQTMSIEL